MDEPLWIVGDVQGYLETLRRVLRGVGLIDEDANWCGGTSQLAVLGDLVDRGPDGVGVIELLMRLQQTVVIGNHDVLLLAARKFPAHFAQEWRESGGLDSDMQRLTDTHVRWLTQLPAMALHQNVLMMHADALFYLDYGQTIDAVNAAFRQVLQSEDPAQWRELIDRFGEHRAFVNCTNADRFLTAYGGSRIVHGHTPVPRMAQLPAEMVSQPHVYCGGRVINVDPGIYLGGPGFAVKL